MGGKQALISEWNINYSCLQPQGAQTFPQDKEKIAIVWFN